MLIRSDQIAEVQLEKQRREVQVYNYLLKKTSVQLQPNIDMQLGLQK